MSDTTGPDFTASVRDTLGGPVIEATGELDLDSAPILHSALHRALGASPPPPMLVIDLAGVTFCDSSGLNALLQARIESQGLGVALHLARPTHTVARVLEITGADKVFSVRNDPTVPHSRAG
ncbi:STAS domain-containing protein [Kitasatospora sp. NPDC048540]|uniref:STAS domain-containing protein n=1 Tax=Kitasatospora sp. NPDC048540 TaxID=3155634 RepID=UPI0033DB1073